MFIPYFLSLFFETHVISIEHELARVWREREIFYAM